MNNYNKNSTDKKAWERMKGEPNKAYNLFKCFLMIGKDRTLNGLRKQLINNPCDGINKVPTLSTLKVYSSKYNWIERVGLYDDYNDKQRLKRQEQRNINKEKEYYYKREPQMIGVLEELKKNISSVFEDLENDNYNTKPTSKAHALKSIANSIDIYIKNTRLLYNLSTDARATNVNADVNSNNSIKRVNYTIDGTPIDEFKTSDEFFKKQWEFIEIMIESNKNKHN